MDPNKEPGRSIGLRVKDTRDAVGISQGALAERAGVSKSDISRLEGGKIANPGVATLLSIAGVLRKSLWELMGLPGPDQERLGESEMLRTLLQHITQIAVDVEDVEGLIALWAALPRVERRVVANLIAVSHWEHDHLEDRKVIRPVGKAARRRYADQSEDLTERLDILGRVAEKRAPYDEETREGAAK